MVVAHPIWSSLELGVPPGPSYWFGGLTLTRTFARLVASPPLQLTTNVTNKTNLFYINHAQASSNTCILNKDACLEVLLSHINLILSIFSSKSFKKDKNPEWSYPSYTLGTCSASLGSLCSPGIILFIQKSNTGPWTSPLPHPPSWKSLAPLLQSQSSFFLLGFTWRIIPVSK